MDNQKQNVAKVCQSEGFNILGLYVDRASSICLQGSLMVAFSRLLHHLLRQFNQPQAISQFLSGILLGPTLWDPTGSFARFVFPAGATAYLGATGALLENLYIFLLGLELRRHRSRLKVATFSAALTVLATSAALSAISAFALSDGHMFSLEAFPSLFLIISSTSSPAVVELCSEKKLATSQVGRLAVSTALLIDTFCLLGLSICHPINSKSTAATTVLYTSASLVIIILVFHLMFMALERFQPPRTAFSFTEIVWVFVVVVFVANWTRGSGLDPMFGTLLLGIFFPRRGRAQKLTRQLVGPVYRLLLPVYLCYAGSTTDLNVIATKRCMLLAALSVFLCILAKLGGSMVASLFLGLRRSEALVLGFLLNLRGPAQILLAWVTFYTKIWHKDIRDTMVCASMLCSVMVGPTLRYILRQEKNSLLLSHGGLEGLGTDMELRMMACIYEKRHLPSMLNLLHFSIGLNQSLLAAYLMHMVELTGNPSLIYQQLEEDEERYEDVLGGEDGVLINNVVDAFMQQTGLQVQQLGVCSSMDSMHKEVCKEADMVGVAIIVLPFHKHQRVNGVMEVTKGEYRSVNRRVQQVARCTVGILVDRGLGRLTRVGKADPGGFRVAVLFFGGADDREALAFAERVAQTPCIIMTLVRFMPSEGCNHGSSLSAETKQAGLETVMSISHQTAVEDEADSAAISNFFDRYVSTGLVSQIEKFVSTGAETVDVLREMEGEYSVYIVGKGKRDSSPLMMGMAHWEECPELGTIGDLLASSDFMNHGSILVIQQHRSIKAISFDKANDNNLLFRPS